jgi:asparagine synthase (glutamine-hydrolysing)
MCGIAGGTKLFHPESIDLRIAKRMLQSIRHRGPDESGIYLSDEIVLGSVRLSIIDISTGQQPLSNSNRDIWIVFNGEIFNYIELRNELIQKGHQFSTQSDTEVIVYLYQQYGIDFINRLNGQFAIAIWDNRKKELILIRDRVGIRPLFYTIRNKELYFASEIKALLVHPAIHAVVSPESLSQIFTFWTCLTPQTPFKDIFELPPGHYLIYKKGGISIKPFWQLEFPEKGDYSQLSLNDSLEKFDELLTDATRIRLRADVPVAAYLSGGLDSTVTTSIIRELVPDMLQTFSIGFSEKDYDETGFQQIASNYFKTRHAGITIKSSEIAGLIPKVIWHCESPLLRTAPAPMFALSKHVRDHSIKVVITGEGADEFLAGYDIFKELKIRHFWAKQPASKLRPLLLKKLYPYIPQIRDASSNALKFFFGYKLSEINSPIYSHLLRWNNGNQIKKYLSGQYTQLLNGYQPVQHLMDNVEQKIANFDSLSKAQWLESTIFLSGYLLSSQGDRMGMANSVEGRYPFLDYRVIEFCARLNPDFKLNGLNEKYLLKKFAKGKIPDEILKRPKQAYRAPIHKSLISEQSPLYVNEMLASETIRKHGIFDEAKTEEFIKKLRSGKDTSEIDDMVLMAILSTSLVIEQFQDKSNFESIQEIENCRIIYA